MVLGLCSGRKLNEWGAEGMLEELGEGSSCAAECLEDTGFVELGMYEKERRRL